MNHPIPDTNDSHSVQIILPQRQLGRKSDMYVLIFNYYSCSRMINYFYWIILFCRYVFCCSYTHNVAPKGKYIAFISAEAETDRPENELKPGMDLLGPVEETFFDIYDVYEPNNNHSDDSCYITSVCISVLYLRYFNGYLLFCLIFHSNAEL